MYWISLFIGAASASCGVFVTNYDPAVGPVGPSQLFTFLFSSAAWNMNLYNGDGSSNTGYNFVFSNIYTSMTIDVSDIASNGLFTGSCTSFDNDIGVIAAEWTPGSNGGAGGGMAIGAAVTGGVPTEILFVAAGDILAQSSSLVLNGILLTCRHLGGVHGLPGVILGTAMGIGSTITLNGTSNDLSGYIQVVSSAGGLTSGSICVITFVNSYATGPKVILGAGDFTSAAMLANVCVNNSAASFTISYQSSSAVPTGFFNFYYHVIY